MILNRGLLIAGAIPLPWNNYSNRSFQRWLKCSHLALFLGLPASAYGLGLAVNRKLPVCLLSPENLWRVGLLSFWTGDFRCSQRRRPCVASSRGNVMEVMMLSNILQNQSDIYQLGMGFNAVFERTKYSCHQCSMHPGDPDIGCTRIILIGLFPRCLSCKVPSSLQLL